MFYYNFFFFIFYTNMIFLFMSNKENYGIHLDYVV